MANEQELRNMLARLLDAGGEASVSLEILIKDMPESADSGWHKRRLAPFDRALASGWAVLLLKGKVENKKAMSNDN